MRRRAKRIVTVGSLFIAAGGGLAIWWVSSGDRDLEAAAVFAGPMPAGTVVEPVDADRLSGYRRIYRRELGATDVAAVNIEMDAPGTTGPLTAVSLVFTHRLDASAQRRIFSRLSLYAPVGDLVPRREGRVTLLVHSDDAVLGSAAAWVHGRRLVYVTGGRLDDETRVLTAIAASESSRGWSSPRQTGMPASSARGTHEQSHDCRAGGGVDVLLLGPGRGE